MLPAWATRLAIRAPHLGHSGDLADMGAEAVASAGLRGAATSGAGMAGFAGGMRCRLADEAALGIGACRTLSIITERAGPSIRSTGRPCAARRAAAVKNPLVTTIARWA